MKISIEFKNNDNQNYYKQITNKKLIQKTQQTSNK